MIKTILAVSLAVFLAGCTVVMVHPKTGERVVCKSGRGHPLILYIQASDCANQYEALGFVRAGNLTPQQAAMVSKPTAQRVEQDITIRQERVKSPSP